METQYSIVQNSIGGGLNVLVMRSWYINDDGQQITIKSEVNSGLTLDECFLLVKKFVESSEKILLSNG
jgi:hypothetical protein